MQNLSGDAERATALNWAAEQFRDQIWVIVESWMQHLMAEEGENTWSRIPETQLVDNLPTLLRGVSKAIEDPDRLSDFEKDGIIHQSATELGTNRQKRGYRSLEVLREQEILREIVWQFCKDNFTALNLYELEWRINRSLNMISSTVTENYIHSYIGELKQLARRDKVTGFLNYESFKEVLGNELRRSRRYRRSFSLMMVDIDNFEECTIRAGRQFGDTLIQEIAAITANAIRSVDIPTRYGADEFAIILPEAGKKQARRAAERLRKTIKLESRHSMQIRDRLDSSVTVSIGLSTYPRDAETIDEIISLADEALYEAKKAGKDMVAEITVRKKR